VGDFTLDKRATGFRNVVMVGTGTGLAPFVSMMKQRDFEARTRGDDVRYTLIHANRTYAELGYHDELRAIAAAGHIDFVYLPSVSRPSPRDVEDPHLGRGRGNNVLRLLLGLPSKEEERLAELRAQGGETAEAEEALARAMPAAPPPGITPESLQRRLDPRETVLLTCGNPAGMADIKKATEARGIKFEKEDW
jgi:ferredoxin-NADP reductase